MVSVYPYGAEITWGNRKIHSHFYYFPTMKWCMWLNFCWLSGDTSQGISNHSTDLVIQEDSDFSTRSVKPYLMTLSIEWMWVWTISLVMFWDIMLVVDVLLNCPPYFKMPTYQSRVGILFFNISCLKLEWKYPYSAQLSCINNICPV